MLSNKDIDQIKNKIVSELRPQKIYIFGSYARENADEESDIDILVIMNTALNQHQRNIQVKKLFPCRSFSMDAFVYTPEEALKYQNIPGTVLNSAVTRGKLLYG